MPPPVAYFAARARELIVIEKPAFPIYEGGRQVGVTPGTYHHFKEHQCKIEGQKSIDFMRGREKALDGPGVWEISAYDAMPAVTILTELATAKRDRVEEILQTEQDGPNRPEIVDTCHAVLERRDETETVESAS